MIPIDTQKPFTYTTALNSNILSKYLITYLVSRMDIFLLQ